MATWGALFEPTPQETTMNNKYSYFFSRDNYWRIRHNPSGKIVWAEYDTWQTMGSAKWICHGLNNGLMLLAAIEEAKK